MPNIKLPEPPTREPEISSRLWVRWFQELKRLLVTQITQAVDWAEINLTSADIADIPVRKHTDLQDLNTATYTHLSSTNATDLTDGGDTTLHFHSADRNSDNFTGTKWVDLTDAGATTLHKHSHNAQDDLQGGSAASYYHLTQTQT
jgi:hypothetical protein